MCSQTAGGTMRDAGPESTLFVQVSLPGYTSQTGCLGQFVYLHYAFVRVSYKLNIAALVTS